MPLHQPQRKWQKKTSSSKQAHPRKTWYPPRLESLEDRVLPAIWSGDIFDGMGGPAGPLWTNGEVQQVVGNVHVPAGQTLTIQEGTVIKFQFGTRLTVDGTLRAVGLPGQTIYFTSIHDDSVGGDTNGNGSGSAPGAGDWSQILFTSSSSSCVIDHAEVRYGGRWADAQVEAVGCSPTLSNTVVRDSLYFGVRLTGSAAVLTGNTFQANGMTQSDGVGGAIHMDVNSQPAIQNATVANNYVNGVWVDPGTLPAGTTAWDDPGVVYFVPRTVTVPQGATLQVAAGQVVKLIQSLVVQGTLEVAGTAALPVVFTSSRDDVGGDTNNDGSASTPQSADWSQILFTSTSTASVIDHAELRYGSHNVDAVIEALSSSPTIRNSRVYRSNWNGVRLAASNATLTGNTFEDNRNGVSAIRMDVASQPTFQGNTFVNNSINGVYVDSGTLPVGAMSWNNPDVVYWLGGTVTVPQGATLTLGEGQVVKSRPNIYLVVAGTLAAQGTVASPVIFTSYRDDSAGGDTNNDGPNNLPNNGDWSSIRFTATSTGSVLDRVEVRYGGYNAGGSVEADHSSFTLRNSVVRNSSGPGVRLTASNAVLTNNTFQNSTAEGAVRMDVASQPTIQGFTAVNNGVNGVVVEGGTLPTGASSWNNPDVVYWLNGTVTVPQGATLTLGEGQVVKSRPNIYLVVAGTLSALGTVARPVVFTSHRDDSAGGDTNNDGPNNLPSAADWSSIRFTPTSTGSVLDHMEVRYGGYNAGGSVEADHSSFTLRNSVVRSSGGPGVRLAASNTALTNNTFRDGTSDGAVRMDVGSQPTIQGSTFVNNPVNGVVVESGTLPTGASSWNNPDAVYWMTGVVTVPLGATLTVGEGQVIKLRPNQYLIVDGTLMAQGSSARPIVFTSYRDDSTGGDTNNDGSNSLPSPSDWSQVRLTSTSTASVLDHVELRYGGYAVDSPLEFNGASPTFSNSLITRASAYALRLVSSSATITGVTFQQNNPNNRIPIRMDPRSSAVFRNSTFVGDIPAVDVDGGTLAAGATHWNNPNLVYRLNGVTTVPATAILTIHPGQILKVSHFNGGNALTVQGTLLAQGTFSQSIIFTAYEDDSAGGDTNGDGSSSIPGSTSWSGIEFTNTSTGNILDHIEVRYAFAGGSDQQAAIEVNGASVTLTNSILRDGVHDGIIAGTNGVLTVTNTLITRFRRGILALAGSQLTAANNTIDNNSTGIEIDSSAATIRNNLVTYSTSRGVQVNGTPTLTLQFNDVFNPGVPNYAGITDPTGSNGNLSVDPKYFNRANGMYQLLAGSPVVDAGTSTGAPPTDRLGNPRFDDPNVPNHGGGTQPFVDLGAFERQQTAVSNIDLATTVVTGPSTGLQDQMVTVNWTVKSLGSETAIGSWHDAVYLSADTVWSPDDPLLGEATHTGNLGLGQTYNASLAVRLPGVVPGNYHYLVRANSRNEVYEGTNLANDTGTSTATVAMDLPALTLGTPTTGQLAATGASKLYRVTAPANGDLLVTLAGPAGVGHELFVSYGDVPTRQLFEERSIKAGTANQSVSLHGTRAGTYYILVYGATVPSTETFTLTASSVGFTVSSVSTARGSNTGLVTVTIAGAGFDGNSRPRLVTSGGGTINPTQVYFGDTGEISATFDLTGRPVGFADVQVVNSGNVTATLAHGFEIIAGTAGRLVTSVSAPTAVRLGRGYQITIDYANEGDADLLAPVMRLENSSTSPLSLYPDFRDPSSSVDLIAVNPDGPAGILPPGAHGQIVIYASAVGSSPDLLRVNVGEYPAVPIDWAAIDPIIRPVGITDANWAPLFAKLEANIGSTWDQFHQTLARDTTLFPAGRGLNYSLHDVLGLETEKAIAGVHPSVTGKLYLGDTAHPLANVAITLTDGVHQLSASSITFTDGSFLLPFVDAGTYTVSLEGAVLTSQSQLVVGANGVSGLQLFAGPGGTISGSVVLGGTGSPVREEAVLVRSDTGEVYPGTTDENGSYSIDSLPAGVYTVQVGGTTVTRAKVTGVNLVTGGTANHINLLVGSVGSIEGVVTGPNGVIAGAIVSAIGEDGEAYSTTTTSTGAYTLSGLAGEDYTVSVIKAGLYGVLSQDVTLSPGGHSTGVDLTMARAGSLTGLVTSNVNGSVLGSVDLEVTSAVTSFVVVSEADGTIALNDLPPGVYTVTPAGVGWMSSAFQVTISAGSTTQVSVQLAPRGVVQGTVTDTATGQGIAKVVLFALAPDGSVASVTTDEQGSYAIPGLDSATYQVILGDLNSPGLAQQWVTIDPNHRSVLANFSLQLAGSVAGTVFAADGVTPMQNVQVALTENGHTLVNMTTDDLGHYVFDIVSAGTYQLEASFNGTAFPAIQNVEISGGVHRTGLNFVPAGDVITGTVVDATSGNPLVGATVILTASEGGLALPAQATLATAADGSFQFRAALAGTYQVLVLAAGHATYSGQVTVVHGTPASLTAQLGPERILTGLVRDGVSGIVLGGAQISLKGESAGLNGGYGVADESGNYQIGGLAPGSYTLTLIQPGYEAVVLPGVAIGTGDQLLNLALTPSTVHLSGVVRNASGPLGQARVTARDASGKVVGGATTAPDGSYAIDTLPPGTYTIQATGLGYRPSAGQVVTVHRGDTLTGIDHVLDPVGLSDFQLFITSPPSVDELTLRSLTNKEELVAFAVEASDLAMHPSHEFDPACISERNEILLEIAVANQTYDELNANQYAREKAAQLALSAIRGIDKDLQSLVGYVVNVGGFPIPVPGSVSALNAVLKILQGLYGQSNPEVNNITLSPLELRSQIVDVETDLQAKPIRFTSAKDKLTTLLNPSTGQIALLLNDLIKLGLLRAGGVRLLHEQLNRVKDDDPKANEKRGKLQLQITLLENSALTSVIAQVKHLRGLLNLLAGVTAFLEDYQATLLSYRKLAVDIQKKILDFKRHCGTGPNDQKTVDLQSDVGVAILLAGGIIVVQGAPVVIGTPPDGPPPGGNPEAPPVVKVNKPSAVDPNDITGPAGFGPQRFLQAATMPYLVQFENDPAQATAAAQIVTVTLSLDADFDPDSFQFTGFGFGSHSYSVPAGLSHYETTLDLRPDGINLLVPVTLDLNRSTGVVTVEFQSLDPLTRLAPDGIDDGFLPVNNANHDGEGYFTYSVRPKANLPSGTTFTAQASIVFDINAAIATPTVVNTLDAGPPTSTVVALAPMQNSNAFTVSWSGSDDVGGSGIATFDVYVSDNGGPFTLWKGGTTQTSATYSGLGGHTYSFFSQAADNVGLRQTFVTTAQATTQVEGDAPTSSANVGVFATMNPEVEVSWSGSDAGSGVASYDVYVSEDGGPFTLWLERTTQTAASYPGNAGHTYSFYSLAHDNAGNAQTIPDAFASVGVVHSTATLRRHGGSIELFDPVSNRVVGLRLFTDTSPLLITGNDTQGDTLTLDITGGEVIPAGVSFQFRGGTGDRIVATGNTNWVLTPTTLKSPLGGILQLTNVLQASLVGGPGNNVLDASTYTGTVYFTGSSGNDTFRGGRGSNWVVETGNVNFKLTNIRLTGLGTDTLSRITIAQLTGGAGNNILDASAFTGTTYLSGGPGNDTLRGGRGFDWLVESANANFTLTNTRLTGRGTDTLTSINGARLTGGVGNNVFNVSNWTLSATLDGNGGTDTLVASNNANFILSDTRLTRSGRAAITMASIEVAQLLGGVGNNALDASAFSGRTMLSGSTGNDTLRASRGGGILLGGAGNDTLLGNAARDLIFGGLGNDNLQGGDEDDLLLHGTTAFDASWAALGALQAEWLRTDLEYAARIAHLRNGGGFNGGNRLTAAKVLDDRSRDLLRGNGGNDWFWSRLGAGVVDSLLDRQPDEVVN